MENFNFAVITKGTYSREAWLESRALRVRKNAMLISKDISDRIVGDKISLSFDKERDAIKLTSDESGYKFVRDARGRLYSSNTSLMRTFKNGTYYMVSGDEAIILVKKEEG